MGKSLIPAFNRQRWADLSLRPPWSIVSSRPARTTETLSQKKGEVGRVEEVGVDLKAVMGRVGSEYAQTLLYEILPKIKNVMPPTKSEQCLRNGTQS